MTAADHQAMHSQLLNIAERMRDMGLCDCAARSAGECCCGAWDGSKASLLALELEQLISDWPAEPMGGWREAGSAPKDGSPVLAWREGFKPLLAEQGWDGDWTYAQTCSECRDSVYPSPTHFMPLPDPPK